MRKTNLFINTMKSMFIYSTITVGINFSSPTITQADSFVSTIATQPGVLTYRAIKPSSHEPQPSF